MRGTPLHMRSSMSCPVLASHNHFDSALLSCSASWKRKLSFQCLPSQRVPLRCRLLRWGSSTAADLAAACEAHAESQIRKELPHSPPRLLRWGASTAAELAAAEAAHGSAHLADTDPANGEGRGGDQSLARLVGWSGPARSAAEDFAAERPLTRAMRSAMFSGPLCSCPIGNSSKFPTSSSSPLLENSVRFTPIPLHFLLLHLSQLASIHLLGRKALPALQMRLLDVALLAQMNHVCSGM